ncbi:hypothetical protein Sjap_025562 [Stephania japonica]|uniref:Uncharacterized protein n=1 Tax=Stephania japonica TaxID=461633 RepID=A0AAP0E205_9MAGN
MSMESPREHNEHEHNECRCGCFSTFRNKKLAQGGREDTLGRLLPELILRLLDERTLMMENGKELLKALNVLILRIMVVFIPEMHLNCMKRREKGKMSQNKTSPTSPSRPLFLCIRCNISIPSPLLRHPVSSSPPSSSSSSLSSSSSSLNIAPSLCNSDLQITQRWPGLLHWLKHSLQDEQQIYGALFVLRILAGSMSEYIYVLSKKLGRDCTPLELYLHVHTKKHDGQTFIDARSERVNFDKEKVRCKFDQYSNMK